MPKTNIVFSGKDIEILICTYSNIDHWRYRNLSAPYWRIYHNSSGISEIFFKRNIEKRRISLPVGTILLIPPNIEFSCNNASSILHLNLGFITKGYNYTISESFFSFPYEGEERKTIEEILNNQTETNRLCTDLVLGLFYKIGEDTFRQITDDNRINSTILQMKEKARGPYSNTLFAKKAGMSVNAFTRLFKCKTGHTPHEYQLKLRIDNSCLLLQFTDKSIDTIAYDCGFKNRAHYSKTFKSIRFLTPVEYRKSIV